MTEKAVTEQFDLEQYLSSGVRNIVRQMTKISDFYAKESLFMAQYAIASKRAASLRIEAQKRGEHIPPFLIASITSVCNLHCAGCYARSMDFCSDREPVDQMTAEDWEAVFEQARDMGIGFILLAGGEPLVRKDVVEKAAGYPEILFPVFTNGMMLTEEYRDLFDRHRNLVPILSVEGGAEATDRRRGSGTYERLRIVMQEMKAQKIVFGLSVTVTSENLSEVTSDEFLGQMKEAGCRALIYVEFVPTDEGMQPLVLSDSDREELAAHVDRIRKEQDSLLIISFPGDEKGAGGCLAAGRGFFHINSHGGAEPCPFSPYSDLNVRQTSLRDTMKSELFQKLQEEGVLSEEHEGGCVLFQKRKQVESVLQSVSSGATE